ncbi:MULTISPECIES: phage tail protein [Saccharopolyspora]|uniref:Phage tail protein n=1 Tax=Saccharopolyspora gregorii TaxID=33914 RepID=A0ABP6RQI3_9PSEU|nr:MULTISPECIES: phage tail protein [Saccharopolyspora]MCA1187278.1 phage tail protein [Saccharopolyspora sp. 6T]MCA1195160.1 phage tail protein [Saccharopolyspora sp. 6V]MCA1228011.1 phage tail protein [Saccharopolyspora sp. 6M]MCA1281482.1 phage tail protein [Saccharopolyspora sp. 7B]
MAEGDSLSVHRFGVQLGGVTVESIKEVSGLTVEQDVVETQQVTDTGKMMNKKQPGGHKGGEVTITRGMTESPEFTKWLKKTVSDGEVEDARENLTIEVMEPNGTVVRRIQLYDAWVSKWEGPGLNAGESNAATEKATITFERIEVE